MTDRQPAGCRIDARNFEVARRVADTVLYEGLVLYPYRASSRKNRFRFQFGVLAPEAIIAAGGSESSTMTIELPVEGGLDTGVSGTLRFLQLRRRTVDRWDGERFTETDSLDVGGRLLLAWDEAVEREAHFDFPPEDHAVVAFEWQPESTEEVVEDGGGVAGRVMRRSGSLRARVTVRRQGAGDGLSKIHVRVENVTPYAGDVRDRDSVLRSSLVGTHLLMAVERGAFVSLLEPPDHARELAESCRNVGAFPVLVGAHGDRRTALGSPIILYDWPAIAPESQGDFFDATEMDEMLTLRTATLGDDEKREAYAHRREGGGDRRPSRDRDPGRHASVARRGAIDPRRLRDGRQRQPCPRTPGATTDRPARHVRGRTHRDGRRRAGRRRGQRLGRRDRRRRSRRRDEPLVRAAPLVLRRRARAGVRARILVAGIGNVFFRDDGFGVAVARSLTATLSRSEARVRDVGIRGLHLAYEIAEGWDLVIAIDAMAMTAVAGTLHLLEPLTESEPPAHAYDGHGMTLPSILDAARALGAMLPRVLLVGCDVADVSEGLGLSAAVESAVPEAARLVHAIVRDPAGARL